MNFESAKASILKRLENELPENLHYHGIDHTFDVLRTIEMYSLMEGVSTEEFELLQTAALYHDSGFIYQYSKNEPIGVKIAQESLPEFGYTPEQIDIVSDVIMATDITIEPESLIGKIMCDSDLDYLGRDDFHITCQKLKIEFYLQSFIGDEYEWEKMQLAFMKKHKYYTKSARELRDYKKEKHIKELQELLNKY